MRKLILTESVTKIYFVHILFLWILCGHIPSFAQSFSVSGTVKDVSGQPVPFASVYVQDRQLGVTANDSGQYALTLQAGTHQLVFKSIGYRRQVKSLELHADRRMDVILEPETLHLEEVTVTAGGEDPAYAIIRKAIERRKAHLEQERDYSVKAYVKGLQRVDKAPEKFFGLDVESALELDSSRKGIVYLSETESDLHVKDRHTYKEVIYSSKVAGDDQGFSFNQASEMRFSFYRNLLLDELNGRGFVSPVADNALFYYRYRLEGSFEENGYTVNKIAVIPRRGHDPVFRGTIYIMDNNWRFHSLDLTLTKETQLEFVDSLNIRQTFVPVADGLWMPSGKHLLFSIKVLKFAVSGYFLAVYSDYRMPRQFEDGFFTNEVVRIEKGSNEKDSLYWQQARPVQLTNEEAKGYHRKDSMAVLKKSEHYLDSLDAETNRFTIGKLIFAGYTRYNRFHKQTHRVSPLLFGLQFNTVEGAVLDMGYTYRKEISGKRSYSVNPRFRYGFSNRHFNANIGVNYKYSPLHQAEVGFRGGTEVADFNERMPVNPLVNSIYTLALGENIKKIYEKRFAALHTTRELMNGLTVRAEISYASRLPLVNTNYYSFRKEEDRKFTANDPLTEAGNRPAFEAHQAFTWKLQADVVFDQQYKTLPDERWRLGSRYPALSLLYRKGLPWAGSDIDYDMIALRVYDRSLKLGLLGNSAFSIGGGGFPNRAGMYYMDNRFFSGNVDIFAGLGFGGFYLLDNYTAFSEKYFLEGHFEHNFEGFILNKVPLLRRLKLQEIIGVNYLRTESLKNYGELFLGVQKVMFRAGWAVSRNPDGTFSNGFRIGLGL